MTHDQILLADIVGQQSRITEKFTNFKHVWKHTDKN